MSRGTLKRIVVVLLEAVGAGWLASWKPWVGVAVLALLVGIHGEWLKDIARVTEWLMGRERSRG